VNTLHKGDDDDDDDDDDDSVVTILTFLLFLSGKCDSSPLLCFFDTSCQLLPR
jgi:hypothetical protein